MFTLPTENSAPPPIFTDGVVQLSEQEREDLGGGSLASRGLKEEEARVEAARNRPRKGSNKVRVLKPKRIPKKVREIQPPPKAEVTSQDIAEQLSIVVKMDHDFLTEICKTWAHLFKLVEGRSSGDIRLVSPANGGIDLEEYYDLKRRMTEAGLL